MMANRRGSQCHQDSDELTWAKMLVSVRPGSKQVYLLQSSGDSDWSLFFRRQKIESSSSSRSSSSFFI
ncbi:hypothetical protein EYF80_002513 [Liparis tanakae]|uniref:Uncharacterized protein n=1 Tax=Liparis tanakae TaxID=230148 RepID=A0A4Z2JBE3_9TELE|nr:hypothetical protein EYF80_002513 [Liparis tanakae]